MDDFIKIMLSIFVIFVISCWLLLLLEKGYLILRKRFICNGRKNLTTTYNKQCDVCLKYFRRLKSCTINTNHHICFICLERYAKNFTDHVEDNMVYKNTDGHIPCLHTSCRGVHKPQDQSESYRNRCRVARRNIHATCRPTNYLKTCECGSILRYNVHKNAHKVALTCTCGRKRCAICATHLTYTEGQYVPHTCPAFRRTVRNDIPIELAHWIGNRDVKICNCGSILNKVGGCNWVECPNCLNEYDWLQLPSVFVI